MPKSLKDIKTFLDKARSKTVKHVTIKKNAKDTKFKVRTSKYLYTLTVADKEKAKKMMSSLPPSLVKKEVGKK